MNGDGNIIGFDNTIIDIIDNKFEFKTGENDLGTAFYNPNTKKFTGTYSVPLNLVCGDKSFEIKGDWAASLKK